MSVADVLLRLRELDQLVVLAHQQAGERGETEVWRGLGYKLEGAPVLTSMDELLEILSVPSRITPIPGTQRWMLGFVSLQGELLTVVDLECFLGGELMQLNDSSKMLVMRDRGQFFGLVVHDVLGIQRFQSRDMKSFERLEIHRDVFTFNKFDHEETEWPIISMAALLNDKRFRQSAMDSYSVPSQLQP